MPTGYGARVKKQSTAHGILLPLLLLTACLVANGCAQPVEQKPAVSGIEPWRWQNVEGHIVTTPHYRLYTTVGDPAVIDRMARLMEAAYAEYTRLAPPMTGVGAEVSPMLVYVFDEPAALAAFTRRLTGADADIYLSVGTGGYTYEGKIVCFLGSEADTHSTLAHEGLHQYLARHFRSRLPPAIEEGLACTFETVTVLPTGDVRFDLQHNDRRSRWLARAWRKKTLIPLSTLILLHGGDLAGRPLLLVEGYYAQCWALARLLREDPAYASKFARLLNAVQSGRTIHDVGRSDATDGVYNPRAIRPLLNRYLTDDWSRFGQDVERFTETLVRAAGDEANTGFPSDK